MKQVSIIGIGCGTEHTMTMEAVQKIRAAGLIIGAERLVEGLPEEWILHKRIQKLTNADAICAAVSETAEQEAVILMSGDVGFFSGARALAQRLGGEVALFPGISSFSYFFARLGLSYEDVILHSAHGREVDVLRDVMNGKRNFYLTGGKSGVCTLAGELTRAGLGSLRVWIGSRLSYPDEEMIETTAKEAAEWTPKDGTEKELAVLLADEAPCFPFHLPGLPDEAFLRGEDEAGHWIPMTKQVIRREVLCEMDPSKEDVVWDVGAGTGSVSVELSHFAKRVYAIEKHPSAVRLIEKNRKRFSCWNMEVVEGEAPKACASLPRPDLVFIGGSGSRLGEILSALPRENITVVLTAVTIETLGEAGRLLTDYGYVHTLRQIQVSEAKPMGHSHMLMANNPVFIITAKK